jgi:hypothetical protein
MFEKMKKQIVARINNLLEYLGKPSLEEMIQEATAMAAIDEARITQSIEAEKRRKQAAEDEYLKKIQEAMADRNKVVDAAQASINDLQDEQTTVSAVKGNIAALDKLTK